MQFSASVLPFFSPVKPLVNMWKLSYSCVVYQLLSPDNKEEMPLLQRVAFPVKIIL